MTEIKALVIEMCMAEINIATSLLPSIENQNTVLL
jgi:hypothetical protein